jgi:4-azaleucine resistance transporter AzlC
MSTSVPGESPFDDAADRRAIRRRALSIAVALVPFGVAFGISCADAGLSVWHALGFSTLVFTGGSQFAAVGVLRDGGAPASAIASALLLGLRSLAYGVVMTPHIAGPFWKRALDSQLMIDESVAVGLGATDPSNTRYGYRWGGLSVFVMWNITTVIGAVIGSNAGDLIETFGIDAAVPASFLALVWPRLLDDTQRRIALLGALIAATLIPLAPPGIPILAAGLAAFAGVAGSRRSNTRSTAAR